MNELTTIFVTLNVLAAAFIVYALVVDALRAPIFQKLVHHDRSPKDTFKHRYSTR